MSDDAERLVVDPLSAGWEALARGAWADAFACFTEALNQDETAEALEGLGFAAWWLNEVDQTSRARERAYRRYHQRGDRRGAARVAAWLAMDAFTRRGEHAIANGWVQRAYRLLEGLDPGPEQVLVASWDAHMTILVEHDAVRARGLSAGAAALARSLGAFDLAMLAQACEGYVRVCEGDVLAGMRLLDEATTAAAAGDFTDPDAVTLTCCYLIYACERVRDLERAAQWCDKLRQVATQWSYHAMFAFCRTHYAGVLISRGAWSQAEEELTAATEELAATHPAMAVEGIVRLAELRRRQGRLDEAAALFDRLDDHPLRMLGTTLALLGRAALALDRGDALAAAELAERFLRAVTVEDRLERVAGIELLIRAQVALGDYEAAASSLRELLAISTVVKSPLLRAAASFSEGVVAVARGDYEEARRRFEDAVDLFERSGSPYETARSRLELASTLSALGRTDAARTMVSNAHAALRQLGADLEAERAEALARDLEQRPGGQVLGARAAPGLTNRELDVLRLVARGLGDKEMAAFLGLSEHTVHRHISNILTKLDLPSRAAAVAQASQLGLL